AGNSAAAGATGAVSGELMGQLIMHSMYPGKQVSDLQESDKQVISALSTLAAGLAGGVTGGSSASALAGAQAGKNAVENNSLGDIAQAQSEGKTLEQKAGEYVEAENERYKKENCAGLSAEACSVKMYDERRESLKETLAAGADFVPVVGDIKSFAEAQSALDYLAAALGLIPGAGDVAGKAIKAAETALNKGELAEASKLINKASDEIVAVSGSKGNWSKELNNPLPNKTYKVDANKTYVTDNNGRVASVEADLSLLTKDRNTYQQCKAGKCGVAGDEGGHLIASIFGGMGEKLNIVPMSGNLNKGAWKQMENTWASALKEGKQVNVKIDPVYSGTGGRPESFNVIYSINGGRPIEKTFINAPGGK
ncbi:DNA/RNA non-specific endonuclease, partial [Pantoea sp. R102]